MIELKTPEQMVVLKGIEINGKGLLIVVTHTLIIIHNLDLIVEFKLINPYFFEGFADAHGNLVFFANMELLNLCMKMF